MSLASIQTLALISYCSLVQGRETCASTGVYEFSSVVIGKHIYKRVWTPLNDKIVSAPMREDNKCDEYAVNDQL